MCITVASLLFLFCLVLPFVEVISEGLYFMIRMALLGLVCITLSILAVFITTSVVETYPHTVRTLALCLFFGCFLLGRSMESIAEYTVSRVEVLEEMFAECAFILLLHMIKREVYPIASSERPGRHLPVCPSVGLGERHGQCEKNSETSRWFYRLAAQ